MPAGVKVAAVVVSLAVAGGAWRYGVAPKPTELPGPRTVVAQAPLEVLPAAPKSSPSLREAAPRSEELAQAQPLGAPAASAEATPSADKKTPAPIVAVVTAPNAERQRSRRRGNAAAAMPRRSAATGRAKPDELVEDVDFGIDEPTPRVLHHVIRTTLD